MKLRNKQTGEIAEYGIRVIGSNSEIYNSLAELDAEWEDVPEEPKDYWCIDWTGGINHITVLDDVDMYEENKKEIGNHFETKEEAEKALEKLKAWKRLKDKGFRFSHFVMYFEDKCGKVNFKWNTDEKPYSEFEKDLLIIFGGEE